MTNEMVTKYKVLKTVDKPDNIKKYHLVNDSEGIAVEWDTYEEAKAIADLFQTNSLHGYTYIVIHPNGKLDV
jgi:hypothetical protein